MELTTVTGTVSEQVTPGGRRMRLGVDTRPTRDDNEAQADLTRVSSWAAYIKRQMR